MLPPEVIEKILFYVDYQTLRTAAEVHPDWRQIIYNNAEKRCRRDIPASHLLDLQAKWAESCGTEGYWAKLYDNWFSWQDINKHVEFTRAEFKTEFEDVTCIATLGYYVVVGLGNGLVKVYDHDGTLRKVFQNLDDDEDEVLQINLIADVSRSVREVQPKQILTTYEDAIFLNDFHNLHAPAIFQQQYHTKTYSAYKDYLALVTKQEELLILHACDDATTKSNSFITVLSLCLGQSPCTLRKTALSKDTCCVLIDNMFRVIYYKESDTCEQRRLIDKKLEFSTMPDSMCRQYTWIFHNEIIIHVYYFMDTEEELLELHYLHSGDDFVKKFNIWHTFKTLVYVVYLHGSTLVLGCSNGALLFYNINDWRQFDVRNYAKQCQLPTDFGPIRSIDVVERCGERTFYVCGNMDIYKVVGTTDAEEDV